MTIRATIAAVCAIIVTATALSGCSTQPSILPGELSGKRVVFLTLSPTCEPCARTTEAVVDTLHSAGVTVTTSATNFGAAADQIQKFNQALATGPDAVIIWPTDTTSIIPALMLAEVNYPDIPIVITTYRPATDNTNLWTAWVGGDDEQLGARAAQSLIDGLTQLARPLSGDVIEIEGTPGAATTIGRKGGFDRALAQLAPGLRLVGSQPGNWDQTEATNVASALFSRDPNRQIVGVYAHSDVMLAGAILAGERDGRDPGSDFIAVGIDCSVEGYRNIESGKQYASGMWDPEVHGATTAEVAIDVLRGEHVAHDTIFATPQITAANLTDCTTAAGLKPSN